MSMESSQFKASSRLNRALKKKDIKVSPPFLSFLDSVAAVPSSAIDYADLKQPHILREAAVFAHYSYFSGKMKEVFEGADIKDNMFMRELMIESSANLADWLVLRHLFRSSSDTYHLVVHTYLKRLAEDTSFSFDSLQEPAQDEEALSYLRGVTIPQKLDSVAYLIEEAMKYTYAPEYFWRSRVNGLITALDTGAFRHDEKIPVRREANVITHNILRASTLENMHAGSSKVTTETVAELKNDAIYKMRDWLSFINALRGKTNNVVYPVVISSYWAMHCQDWAE